MKPVQTISLSHKSSDPVHTYSLSHKSSDPVTAVRLTPAATPKAVTSAARKRPAASRRKARK